MTDDRTSIAEQELQERVLVHGPRRWNEGEERQMLWGAVFFLGLGLYAAAFVLLGMWLIP